MLTSALLWVLCTYVATSSGSQQPLKSASAQHSEDLYYHLPNEIHRVAVIGAGPSGLQFTSTLINHGFEVRMFERAPNPGGVWQYTDKLPIHASFPNRPIETMAYLPDIPDLLPATRVYEDGDEGLTLDWRIREHWSPSPIWQNMTTTAPYQLTTLPDITYPKNTPWKVHQLDVTRHVRQYASSVGLNSNDDEHANVTEYSTRVERVEKLPGSERRWTVTLRRMTPLRNGKLEVQWWQEQFDAVVTGNAAQNDAAWIPSIPGLDSWAHALPSALFHSREYRSPQRFVHKNVLILGGGLSGVGIANDLTGYARSVTVSTRNVGNVSSPLAIAMLEMFHKNVTHIPELKQFNNRPSPVAANLQHASIALVNNTILSGYDAIILATGHRRSLPYLVGFHNSSIKGRDEPETITAPIITDGTHLRSLHWTGHYINDPTLLFSTENPWVDGSSAYQAIGAARVWSGKARLPSIAKMWEVYPGAANLLTESHLPGRSKMRQFLTWLNSEILEFGGSMISPPPVDELLELYQYYNSKEYPAAIAKFLQGFPPAANPHPKEGGNSNDQNPQAIAAPHHQVHASGDEEQLEHWAELSWRW
ncbi:FAD/NAD(P)-binding domain-containing protein [Clavulina sp. PMI_390]|nr:FAD/NAD(P)-binding domain-containing protein [Clavulina sp. PMI_390]